MSRSYCSYDEEWQRRKSVLIRSLFHDIPILSPVEEESNESVQDYYVPTQEVFPSPPRPYSPLPPLIIERVPVINKHDEPEEYYRKLHKKIKRIYLKLFIEKRNLSSVDYDSNYNESSANDDNLTNSDDCDSVENLDFRFLESVSPDNGNFDSIILDREAKQSSASSKSNGYGADFESMDTEIVDVINHTTSNEDAIMISDLSEEECDTENFDGNKTRNIMFDNKRSNERKTSSRERTDDQVSSEEQHSRHSTIEDQEMTESVESNKTENEQSTQEEESNTENIDEPEINEISQSGEADRVRIDDTETSGREESDHSRINEQVRADSQETRQQSVNVTKTDSDSRDSEPNSKGSEKTASGGGNELMESNVQPIEGDVETSSSSEGPDYRQITIEALIHFDGIQDFEDRESRVYEDSLKSVILPTRFRRVVSHNVDDRIEVIAVLEEKDDPKTAAIFDIDDVTTDENLEEEITPTLDIIEQRDEKMRTSQDAIDKDTVVMRTPTPETNEQVIEAPEENVEVDLHSVFTEKDHETIRAYQSDATNAEMRSHQLDNFEKKIEAMRTLQQAFTEKYLEKIKTQSVVTDKEIERVRTPQQATIEKDFERTRIITPQTIEEMRSDHPEAAKPETKSHHPETIMEEDEEESDEEIRCPHPIEVMRTPRPHFSHGTIPETHESDSGSTSERTAFPQEATAMTSSFQDGVDNNISDLQTSNDINEILTSIFNESPSKVEASVSGRKRKLVNKSVQAVQTSRVTWEDMRTNFFVATPKIFRLCACTDHICY